MTSAQEPSPLKALAARVFEDSRLASVPRSRLPDDLCLVVETGGRRLEVFAEHDGGRILSVTARRDGDRTSELRFEIDVDTWKRVETGGRDSTSRENPRRPAR